jgi:hypothetical protein
MLALALSGTLYAQEESEKDTLRTYGPRIGIDLARFLYLIADPPQTGAELNVDFEIFRNIYPVFELGYNNLSDNSEAFSYSSSGSYGRAGIDYNVLSLKDRSAHHTITLGFRYGISLFKQEIEDVLVQNVYWGDYLPEAYENNLTGHWIELVGGMRAEVFTNFFMGWTVRYKILINADGDPLMKPQMIPGYGSGGEDSVFGLTYTLAYKIPLFKK